jgi:hypothetical protein
MPVAFQGPAARSIATAAAVAAIAAGGALAATQLGQSHHDSPVPPASSVGTSGTGDDHGSRQHRTTRAADTSQTNAEEGQPAAQGSTAPDFSSSTQAVVPSHEEHGSPGSDDSPGDRHQGGGPGDEPTSHDGGRHGGSGGPDSSGGPDGSQGGGDGSQDGSGGKDSGGGGSTDSELDGAGD